MTVEEQMECRLCRGNRSFRRENLPHRHFCPSQNPTWPDPGLNPDRRCGKPATNRLNYGAAAIRALPSNSTPTHVIDIFVGKASLQDIWFCGTSCSNYIPVRRVFILVMFVTVLFPFQLWTTLIFCYHYVYNLCLLFVSFRFVFPLYDGTDNEPLGLPREQYWWSIVVFLPEAQAGSIESSDRQETELGLSNSAVQ
jgi:hypothetical protein